MIDLKSDSSIRRFLGAVAWRAGLFLLLAVVVGSLVKTVCGGLESKAAPAGFGRGMLQGALMPMTWPALAAGHDVTIYSAHNTGVSYKLGYTAGVNLCGAVFFGLVFQRLNRLRSWARNTGPEGTEGTR
jgi:uncharacterized transporter YbjL